MVNKRLLVAATAAVTAFSPFAITPTFAQPTFDSLETFQMSASSSANGLTAEYFNNINFSNQPVLKRVDTNVNFYWGFNAPDSKVPRDNFSVRWSGEIESPVDGNVVFSTFSDEGVRLWIDDQLVIDNWKAHRSTWDHSRRISLRKGEHYSIKMEFYDQRGEARAQLLWSYEGSPRPTPIPTQYLFPIEEPVSTVPGLRILPPTNPRVKGILDPATKRGTDQLSWDPVPGAVSYNVYQYDLRIGTKIKGTNFMVPSSVFYGGMTYTITAVDNQGNESIPSCNTLALGIATPRFNAPAATPRNLKAVPEWNLGRPRIHLTWHGSHENNYTYNIYRDGKLVAEGVWGLVYLDGNVQPGKTYRYTVVGVTAPWNKPSISSHSTPVQATALPNAPKITTMGEVKVTRIVPNDDSAVIEFAPVPGAVDYRAYQVGKEGIYKYSGGGLSIEMNGLDPSRAATFVVEALDKMGPYQKMDGFYGPGAMNHDGSVNIHINGQGDPSNVPIVVAQSSKAVVVLKPFVLSGQQKFIDNFRNSKPFTKVSKVDPRILAAYSIAPSGVDNPFVQEFQNDKWIIRNYLGDMENTQLFVMGNHFMDTLYDGGTPRSNVPMHNNTASLVMLPKAAADISGNKVLHVTFEVDAHFNARRWCDVFIAEAGDPLLNPGRFQEHNSFPATGSGRIFRWEIMADKHDAQLFMGLSNGKQNVHQLFTGADYWNGGKARRSPTSPMKFNGSQQDHDRRNRFDLYLSRNRFQMYENNILVKDGSFPQGVSLPFTKMDIYFVHQVYHTGLDRPGSVRWAPEETYWINHRPWADERHWDNMGFEVLNSFPK